MKRHLQKTGVRKFFGQDLIDLQSEPLKALDGFFAEYGACIITGCEITPAENDTFNIAPGLVAVEITDPETGKTTIKVMPFDGAEGVVLPLYITANHTTVERVYGDGKVKPIAYDFHAVASGVQPETPHITLTTDGGNRFVDVLQDDKHSFITAQERSKWNAILQAAKDYADIKKAEAILTAAADASTKSEATLRTSKEYTDGKDAVLRNDMTVADTATLRTAKEYADRIVAALVDNSPEALNTLQELAKALGNDPNFATTVMQAIGERMKTTDVNAALAGKANSSHSHSAEDIGAIGIYETNNVNDISQTGYYRLQMGISSVPPGVGAGDSLLHLQWDVNASSQTITEYESDKMWMRRKINGKWQSWVEMYHSGNLNPIKEGETALSGEASSVVIENTGTGGLGTRQASLLLKWYGQFAGISVLRGSASDVQALGVNINNEIVARFFRDSLYIGGNQVYHAGNFNPGAKADKHEAICWKGEGAHLNPDNLKETGYYFVYNPGPGTILVIAAFPGGRHPMQIFVPYNYSGIKTRSFNTDAGTWSPWVEMYHSGNLDKTKLDNGLLAGYQVHTSGSISQRYGPKASSASLVTKIGTGKCRVPHNIGNSNYIAIVTAVGTVDNATRGIYNAAVMQQGDNAVDVILSDSTNGTPIDGTFNIVLMGAI